MNPQRVLVVDDEPDIVVVIEACLAAVGGMEVEIASSGVAALHRLHEQASPEPLPDVVLLDVMMPGLDGLQTLRALSDHPRTAGLPVILMTARTHLSALAELHAVTPLGVIVKPFDPMELADQVRAFCADLPGTSV